MRKAHAARTKVRLGLAGLVHDHARAFIPQALARSEVELVGIVETDAGLIHRYAREFGLHSELFVSSLDGLFSRGRIDGIAGFTSTFDHGRLVEACAQEQVHVMVEKPLAVNVAHAQVIAAAARGAGIQVLTNYATTCFPSTHAAMAKVRSGQLGDLRRIVVNDGHAGPKAIPCSREFLAWLTNPLLNGGGAMTDFGCYGAVIIPWLLGGRRPESIIASIRSFQPDIYPGIEDDATILLNYPDAQGVIQASWQWPFGRKDIEIYGTAGSVIALESDGLRVRTDQVTETVMRVPWPAPVVSDPAAHFAAVISGRVRPHAMAALPANLLATEILDAARESARRGEAVRLSRA
jgi:predicted dehydrogenase